MEILNVAENFGLTLKKIGGGKYNTSEHDSLILHTTGRHANTFYWNSEGIGGGCKTLYKTLISKGYSPKTESYKSLSEVKPEKVEPLVAKEMISRAMVEQTITRKDRFSLGIKERFGASYLQKAHTKYSIGQSKYCQGDSTIFWQQNAFGNYTTSKIMQYGEGGNKLKRLKQSGSMNWIHNLIGKTKDQFINAKFGLHLAPNFDTFCIVESEKTAIILSLFFDDIGFIASGGQSKTDFDILLHGKQVLLCPDISDGNRLFLEWQRHFQTYKDFKTIDIRNLFSTELPDKYDLADAVLEGLEFDFDFALKQNKREAEAIWEKGKVHKIETSVYVSPSEIAEQEKKVLAQKVETKEQPTPTEAPTENKNVVLDWENFESFEPKTEKEFYLKEAFLNYPIMQTFFKKFDLQTSLAKFEYRRKVRFTNMSQVRNMFFSCSNETY